MVIFYSYVKLPEGNIKKLGDRTKVKVLNKDSSFRRIEHLGNHKNVGVTQLGD